MAEASRADAKTFAAINRSKTTIKSNTPNSVMKVQYGNFGEDLMGRPKGSKKNKVNAHSTFMSSNRP